MLRKEGDRLALQLRVDTAERLAYLKRRIGALAAESVMSGMSFVLVMGCLLFTLVQWMSVREQAAETASFRFKHDVSALKSAISRQLEKSHAADRNPRSAHHHYDLMRWLRRQSDLPIRVRLYDAERAAPENLIFDSHPAADRDEWGGGALLAEEKRLVSGEVVFVHFSTLPPMPGAAARGELSFAFASGFPVMLIFLAVLGATMRAGKGARVLAKRIDDESAARHEVEQYLSTTSSELSALVKASPHAIVMEGTQGEFLVWNQAAERLFGWTEAEAKRFSPTLLPPGVEESYRLQLIEAEWSESQLRVQTVCQCRDGQFVPVELSAAPVHNTRGVQLGTVMYFVDITERLRVEEDMRRSEQRYRSLAAAMTELEWRADAQGRFMQPQESWAAYTGQERDKYQEWGYIEALHEEDREYYLRKWAMHRILEEPFECEVRLWHAESRSYRYVLSRCVPIGEPGGRVREWVGTISDIDDRKRAEDRLQELNSELESRVQRRTLELQHTVRELEAFSGAVSHDLYAPLTVIDGFSAALEADFGAGLPSEAKRHLERIRRSVGRMRQIIEDLLKLARLSNETLTPAEVDLAKVARGIVSGLKEADPAREIEVVIPNSLPARADSHLIRIVLENLIGNAWKYTGRTPKPKVEIGIERQDGRDVFYVRDNGAGFDMAYAGRLFEPFQRLHFEDEFPGNGIGLTTVHRIIQRHHGRIWAEAAVDRGATFYFTLGER
jgi:PAS domain S-box-containing protein